MIEIRSLSFAYGQIPVFENIDLSFASGNIYGLLGENGVGKTTLLKLVSGLLCPHKGVCQVDGMNTFDRRPDMLQRLFFLPDSVVLPHSNTPITFAESLAPFYPSFDRDMLFHVLDVLEVNPEWDFYQMSYGQQKKALIAAALSMRTDYLLLDEPTNGLDIPSKSQFRSILSQRLDDKSTIIISTHQVKDVESLINPIVILTRNSVLLNASLDEIAQKLYFEHGTSPHPGALFSEMQIGGCLNVLLNTTGRESVVSIEALFNAAHRNPALIKSLFTSSNPDIRSTQSVQPVSSLSPEQEQ